MKNQLVLVVAAATLVSSAVAATAPAGASGPRAADTAAATAAVGQVATARARGWRPRTGPVFNVPRARPANQFRIERRVLEAIRHARKGSVIKMSMFSFDRFPVADALIDAKRRGVQVQVLVNNHEMTPAQRKLRKRLGKNRYRRNFAYQCRYGCRSRGGILHSKIVLFSHTGVAHNVVMLGSVNMKMNGAKNQYNDLLTMSEASGLYRNLSAYFQEMRRDRPARPAYWRANLGRAIALRASPWAGRQRDDPLMKMLAPIRCRGASTPNGRTRVLINMHAWNGDRGMYIARRVRELYLAGCDVRVQYGYGGRGVRRVLGAPSRRGRMPMRSNGLDTNDDGEIDLYSHMKMVIISGNYAGARNRKVVITGSTNFQGNRALISGDELIFRIYSPRFYFRYQDHFNWMWNKKTRPAVYINQKSIGGRKVLVDQDTLTWPRDIWKQG